AENRPGSGVEQSCDHASLDRDRGVAKRVDASMPEVELSIGPPAAGGALAQAAGLKLTPANNAPLLSRQPRSSKRRGLVPRGGTKLRRFGHAGRIPRTT